MSRPQDPGGQPVEVCVLVTGAHLAAIEAVAADLERTGLRVSDVMGTVGVITGITDDTSRFAAFEALDGVESVEVARTFQLPPPDSPIQ